MNGSLFMISAPSGTGKTSLVRALCRDLDRLKVSVSCTTRARRPGEKEGVDYHFIDTDTFNEMVSKNLFLEHERVFDHLYGTPRAWVEQELAAGYDVILEIDWQGARDVRKLLPEKTVSIFLLPPSFADLEKRLRERGQDDESIIRRRMLDALGELRHFNEFDYLVVNDDFDRALAKIGRIIECHRRGKPCDTPDLRAFAEQLMTEGGFLK